MLFAWMIAEPRRFSDIRFVGLVGRWGWVIRALATSLWIGTVSFPAPASAEPVTLSENQALQLFFERNLDLLAARYNIDNAQAQEIIAAAIPNPTLGIQISELSDRLNEDLKLPGCPRKGSCGPAVYYSFSQLIEMAGRRGLRMESSAIATQAAESDFRDAVRIFANIVRDAYFGLLQAQKSRWLAQDNAARYQTIVRDNRLRLQAGDIAESDFLRINVEALKAQSDLDNAQAAVEQAQASLAVTLNWPDKSMQFAAEDKWPEIRDIGQSLSRETLIEKALALRPDLQGDLRRAEQAEKQLTLARRLKYPDITVNGGYAHDPANNALHSGFIGLSVPVPLFYQYKGEADQAAVNLNQTQLAVEQTTLAIRNDVATSLAAWQSADKVVRRFEGELLKQAEQVRDRAELAYNKGATSILDLVDAQRTYRQVMLDYYTAAINRINAYYDLAKSVGVEPSEALEDSRHALSEFSTADSGIGGTSK